MRLYIDPGTGSMLFAVLISAIGVLYFSFRGAFVKLKFLFSGGRVKEKAGEDIPLVIFSDDKRYWQVFEPICRELDARGFNIEYMSSSPDDPALKNTYSHVKAVFVGEGNKAFAKLNFLKATILLSTTPGLDVYQWKRSKDVKYYIHIPHMPGELTTYRMFGVDYYDAMLLSGKYQIDDCRALEKLRNLPEKECTIVGIPYLDEKAKRLANCLNTSAENETITVLVAPSWGVNSLFNRFGNKLIDQLIATGYHIIIRPHPQSFVSEKELIEQLMKEYPGLEWNRDTDNFEVLNRSDIMISDFSGVIFDFSLVFDKPVISAYTDFDDSQYDAWWLDTPIWTATAVPRIGPILSEDNVSEIKQLIDQCLTDESYSENRKKVRDETWENRDRGACIVADYLMKKYVSLTEEPANKEQILTDKEEDAAEDLEIKIVITEEANVFSDGDQILHGEKSDIENNLNSHRKIGARKIPILIGIGAFLVVFMFGVQSYLENVTEKALERTDLETMKLAENLAKILKKQQKYPLEEKKSFWLNTKSMSLVPAEYDKPAPYGVGTTRTGGATKKYTDENGHPLWNYDENKDYTKMIVKVTVDPDSEDVAVEWVNSNVGLISTESEEIVT